MAATARNEMNISSLPWYSLFLSHLSRIVAQRISRIELLSALKRVRKSHVELLGGDGGGGGAFEVEAPTGGACTEDSRDQTSS
ncbi:hypothetical protein C2S51_029143 [Perilla frutescens var. frutescens]|nr:hypothetical protein C2S51_029143 [Perilla frutescens var. frutescens]